MRPKERLTVIQRSVVREMARYGMEFAADGEVVRGPGTTAVAVREHPGDGGGHVDLGFVLQLGRADSPVVWDCTAGLGRTEEERLDSAVRMWAATTASAMVELLDGRGEHADHYRHEELPGWHAVQGPASVFGFDHQALADWLADHQVLPPLAEALRPVLAGDGNAPGLHGVKLFLGGRAGEDVAEVRIDGEVSTAASALLRGLAWPRGERLCWARAFVLLVPEGWEAARSGTAGERAGDDARPKVGRAGAPPDMPQAAPAPRRGLLARWRRVRRADR